MKVYVLRHGTTAWNAAHRVQGQTDTDLDDTGILMAVSSREGLLREAGRFGLVFSSPLKRAVRTAELITGSSSVVTDSRLSELAFGRFEGQNVDEMLSDPSCAFRFFKKAPDLYDREIAELLRTDPEGGWETLTSAVKRTSDFISEMLIPRMEEDINVLISAHGAINRAFIMSLTGETDLKKFWGTGLQGNCGVITASSDPSGRFIVSDEIRTYYDPSLRTSPLL